MPNVKTKIITIKEKKLIGLKVMMTLDEGKTFELWNRFMIWYKNTTLPLPNFVGTDLYSVQIYNPDISFEKFTKKTIFEKCAMIEVKNFDHVPQDMDQLILPEGLYAVFIHRGTPEQFPKTQAFIFGKWLPQSKYQFDNRPQFEIMGDKYIQGSIDSEEEVWIPIKEF